MRILLSMAVLTGCGGGGGANVSDAAGTIDGAHATDAALDAPSGPTGPVTLTVASGGVGAMGITVYFQNADSSLVSKATTDVSGSATAVMAAGGFVTALLPQSPTLTAGAFQQVQIETIAGVKPGDDLQIYVQDAVVDQAVSFTAGLSGLGAGATYTLFTTCPNSPPVALADVSGNETGSTQLAATCTNANVSVWAHSAGGIVVATDTAVAIGGASTSRRRTRRRAPWRCRTPTCRPGSLASS